MHNYTIALRCVEIQCPGDPLNWQQMLEAYRHLFQR